MFVPRHALAEILARAELASAMEPSRTGRAAIAENVTYLPCPLCHASMNRVNFGKVSGVIVDVCRKHGTWFDGGELTRVVAFVAGGGREKTTAREARDQDEQRARAREIRVSIASGPAPLLGTEDVLHEWRRVVEALLFF